jgi:hypothetical protein
MTIRTGFGVLLSAAALLSPSVIRAQPLITLEGVVRDSAGGIERVEVSAFDSLRNHRRTVLTTGKGYYRMLDLTPGRYLVSARIVGHGNAGQSIDLTPGQRAVMDFFLHSTRSVLATVQVQAQRSTDAIERMSVTASITSEQIRELPRAARNVMDFAAIAPGIRSFQPVEGRSLPAAGALRDERGLNLYIDGVEMKNFNSTNIIGSPQTGSALPSDALEELRVFLNPYDAEYARGAGYIFSAVSHRGTNEKHGSAFALFQNKDLTAVNEFQRSIPNFTKPDFRRRQMGFNLRGPLVRNRVFYAASYELSDTETYIAVVPGKPAGDPTFWDDYAGVFNAPNQNHVGLLRLTYAAGPASTFEGIWSIRYMTGESFFGGTESRESAISQKYAVNTVNLRHRWVPVARLANELSLQFVRWSHVHARLFPGPELRYPTLKIRRSDGDGQIREMQFRAVERLTYSVGTGPGSHLLKGGMEVSRVFLQQYTPNLAGGLFRFRSETADPFEGSIAVGLIHPESRQDADGRQSGWVASGYLNDEWHLLPRLIVNAGLRYDAELNTLNNDFVVPWVNDPELSSRPELEGLLNRGHRKEDFNNISPRLSFSWDVTGNRRAFVRGGFGIMFDRIPGFVPMNERRSATWRIYSFPNPGTVDPEELRNRVLSGGGTASPPMIVLMPQRMDVPENRQWSVGLGAQVTPSLALNVDYIDQDIRHLYASVNLNWLDASQTPAKRVLSPAYGNIIAWGDFARARYNALLTSISYAPRTSTLVKLSHTLASAKADWDVDNLQSPASSATSFYVMQRTSGDERHRFVLSAITPLPIGLRLSTITTVASPRPYRAMDGRDINRNNFFEDDFIDGKRYRVPPNEWKNWYRVVDLRLTKGLDVGRGTKISLIVEAFNVLNTENYSGYFSVQRSSAGDLRPDFGLPDGTFAARQFQLGTRLEF